MKYLFWFIGLIACTVFGGHYYVCHIQEMCPDCTAKEKVVEKAIAPVVAEVEKVKIPDLNINYKGNPIYNFKAEIVESENPMVTDASQLKSMRDTVYNHLYKNHHQRFVITSYYDGETETEADALARGQKVWDMFNVDDLDASNCEMLAVAKQGGGYDLSFADNEIDDEAVFEELNNRVLYCAFGDSEFQEQKNLNLYIGKLKEYLEGNPSANLAVVGHTDDVGKASSNKWLGLKRAKLTKAYFMKHGILSDRIATGSKGETQPIASNKTDEGQAKNRRIVIKINK